MDRREDSGVTWLHIYNKHAAERQEMIPTACV